MMYAITKILSEPLKTLNTVPPHLATYPCFPLALIIAIHTFSRHKQIESNQKWRQHFPSLHLHLSLGYQSLHPIPPYPS
jgi:hypothetical protein